MIHAAQVFFEEELRHVSGRFVANPPTASRTKGLRWSGTLREHHGPMVFDGPNGSWGIAAEATADPSRGPRRGPRRGGELRRNSEGGRPERKVAHLAR